MIDDRFGHAKRPDDRSRAAFLEEKRQAELRRDFERKQEEQQERQASIKEQFGPELARRIEIAGVEDQQIKALAVDYLVKDIAASVGHIEPDDLSRLCKRSIEQAYKFDELQRQQQQALEQNQQPRDEQLQDQPRGENPTHYYAALKETHRQVDNAITAEREAALDDGAGRGQIERRYALLDETHSEVAEASKPLDRSEREAKEAEAQLTAGEMGDAKQSRASMLRALKENFARENQSEHEAEQGRDRDLGMSD